MSAAGDDAVDATVPDDVSSRGNTAGTADPCAAGGSHDSLPDTPPDPETALREAASRYSSVVEGSLQGIIIQQDDRIVYANPAMATLFGYETPEAMVGLDPFEDLIDEDRAPFRERTARAYAGERMVPTPPWRARHHLGRPLWVTSSAFATQWNGRPAVTSFYADATERQLAESGLRESEARYRAALEAGRMGAWETDLANGTRTWTEEGVRLFGLEPGLVRGTVGGEADELLAAMHPEDRHLMVRFHTTALTADSFPAEYRLVRPDGTVRWFSGRGQVIERNPQGVPTRLVSIMVDITERKESELQVKFLLREMSHRTKNMLAVIQAIARQTATTADSLDAFKEDFQLRLRGLSASHDLLIREGWGNAPLADLVTEQLSAFVSPDCERVTIAGPAISVSAEAAQALGLAMHELATNAVKHGALSTGEGRIHVGWTVVPDPATQRLTVTLTWKETGGPEVSPPTRRGFGHTVLANMIQAALAGRSELDFARDGMRWTVVFPTG